MTFRETFCPSECSVNEDFWQAQCSWKAPCKPSPSPGTACPWRAAKGGKSAEWGAGGVGKPRSVDSSFWHPQEFYAAHQVRSLKFRFVLSAHQILKTTLGHLMCNCGLLLFTSHWRIHPSRVPISLISIVSEHGLSQDILQLILALWKCTALVNTVNLNGHLPHQNCWGLFQSTEPAGGNSYF